MSLGSRLAGFGILGPGLRKQDRQESRSFDFSKSFPLGINTKPTLHTETAQATMICPNVLLKSGPAAVNSKPETFNPKNGV